MKAITQDRYGSPDVLQIGNLPDPTPGVGDLLVEVHATSVTTADWRFRASAFPGGMWLPGRLMAGLFRPRNPIPGRDFAGRVVKVGANVTDFAPGDMVFGVTTNGATAELTVVPANGAVARIPEGLSPADAAALPFGAITAMVFVRDMARVKQGERVLITGASGGVGVYAVQLAKYLGAEVTAVCSGKNADLVRSLGADHVVDYTREDPRDGGKIYDVIVDAVSTTTFHGYRPHLSATGRHAFIEAGFREIWQSIVTPRRAGPTVLFGIADDSRENLIALRSLVEEGALRPVIGDRFGFDDTAEAHRVVEARRRRGAVIVDVVEPGVQTLRRVG